MTANAALLWASADALKAMGHFGANLKLWDILEHCSPNPEPAKCPVFNTFNVGAIIAHCNCGPPWEALVVSWLAVEGDRHIALFEPVTPFSCPAPGFHFNSHSSADWKSKNASTITPRF